MQEIKILFDSVLYAVYISPLIFLLPYIAYLFFVKYKKQTSDFVEEGISSEDEMDIFGLNQLKDEKKLEEIINLALKNRILVLKSGKNIIRFLPPLNISKKEMKQGFKRFENALIEIEK